jgi:transposase
MLNNWLSKNYCMDKFKNFIGIDISKLTFDVALIKNSDKKTTISNVFPNDEKGFKDFALWLKQEKVKFKESLFCMEHTGYYGKLIASLIHKNQGALWIEMSLKIIRSLGIQRGKSDKLDAQRIAHYALRNTEDFVPYEIHRPIIDKIKHLLNAREILVQTKSKLKVQINELARMDKALAKEINANLKKSIQAIEADIEKIESNILTMISNDDELKRMFDLVTSVPGIGKITFYYLIYFTNEFKNYTSPKQLACYCGVVPFEHTSGSSVKGRPKVHNMANKKMKKLLHTAALCAVTYYPEFKTYYNRKQDEKKNNMLILNNVRNKLVLRISAVIKNNKVYEPIKTA